MSGDAKKIEKHMEIALVFRILKCITIEPAVFMISLSMTIENISNSQIVIDKTCNIDYEYNDTVCDSLVTDFKDENSNIQKEVAQFQVYKILITSIFPIFFAFYLGAWADLFGRKLLLNLFFASYIIQVIIEILCAYFSESKKEWLLLAGVPFTLVGGFGAWSIVINAFISDTSETKDRSMRFGMLKLSETLGKPLGALLGNYIINKGGYVWSYGIVLAGIVIGAIYVLIRIQFHQWKDIQEDYVQKGAFSPSLVKDSIMTTLKKRPGPTQKFILLLITMILIDRIVDVGIDANEYNYTRTKFEWEMDQFSQYTSIFISAIIVGQGFFIPLVAYFKPNEVLLMSILLITIVSRFVIQALATSGLTFYIGAFVFMFGSYSMSIEKSLLTQCVSDNELGKVFAFNAALENFGPLGASQIYASVWKASDETFPGAILMLSAGLIGICLCISIYFVIILKGKSMKTVVSNYSSKISNNEDKFKIQNCKISSI